MKHAARMTASVLVAGFLVAGCAGRDERSGVTRLEQSDAVFQRETVAYLASDALEGRGLGTRGQELAGTYVAEVFRKSGLRPVPGQGFFQEYEYQSGMTVGKGTGLLVDGKGLGLDGEFRVNSVSSREKSVEGAEAVFVGYGISSTEYGWDDYADVDVKGKVVVAMRFEPRGTDGKSLFTKSEELSGDAAISKKVTTAFLKGAVGVVLVNPESELGGEDVLSVFSGRGNTRKNGLPVMQVTRAGWERVAGGKLKAMVSEVVEGKKPRSGGLGVKVSMKVELTPKFVKTRNVIGYLPGKKKDEFVVVGAHYDHLGMGGMGSLAGSVNAIHHGADDNASGTTAMLTLARRFGAAAGRGEVPERSMLFMAYSCEELGLIGSDYWTEHPTVPLGQVKYMLNLDMVGRMKNNILSHGGEGTAGIFEGMLKEAYAGVMVGGKPLVNKSIGKGGFGPSDHQSFASKRVPVLFLFTGLHGDYHRPSDTADKLNYEGMLAVTEVAERVAKGMLGAPVVAYDSSHDGDAVNLAAASTVEGEREPTTRQERRASGDAVGLGLVPDMNVSERGMKVDGVREGGPAAKVGIKAGDLLLELDGSAINSVEDLQNVYDGHKPGDKVKAVVEREGKKMEFEVVFTRRAARN